ncbi:MAG: hypothetical protein JWN30_2363 [Bacilli bacterium]|nr:hypothetical protein [Bacilli bacterium]
MRQFIWGSFGMYVLGGMTTVLFGSVLPELITHYHVTYSAAGLLVFLQAFGFLIGVPLVLFLMSRIHYKYILSFAALAVALSQLCFLFLPPLQWVYGFAILNGAGASALETAVASYVMESLVGQRAVFMSRLEVAFGMGALSMPVIVSWLIALNAWRLSFFVIGCIALFLSLFWQVIPISLQAVESGNQLDAETYAPPEFKNRRTKLILLFFFLTMIFIYVGVEGGLNSFLPSIFTTYLKMLPYYASLSSSVFWTSMVLGRIAIGWVARRISYERYLLWSVLGTIVFLILLAGFHNQFLCFGILIGLGISMSAIYSITMVYANHTFSGRVRAVTSLVTAVAGMGGAIIPATLGYAMDYLQPERILWMFVGFAIFLLVSLLSIFASLHLLRQYTKQSTLTVE